MQNMLTVQQPSNSTCYILILTLMSSTRCWCIDLVITSWVEIFRSNLGLCRSCPGCIVACQLCINYLVVWRLSHGCVGCPASVAAPLAAPHSVKAD